MQLYIIQLHFLMLFLLHCQAVGTKEANTLIFFYDSLLTGILYSNLIVHQHFYLKKKKKTLNICARMSVVINHILYLSKMN